MDAMLRSLASRTRGQVITAEDPAWGEARRTFNGMLDRRPHVIVRPADTADVVAAVRWAVNADRTIAVRGGGHSVAGHSIADDALVIDLSRWRAASADPARRTVEALGGCLLMDLDTATAAYGLAVPSGTFVDTGIGGLTLGGGIGYIVASEGFACDALVGAELVTADGRVIEVDEDRTPDLLWALRGGGGNFGVVTRFRYTATPVDRMYGGGLLYRGDGVRDVLELLFALDRSAPDELVLMGSAWWSVEDDAPGLSVLVAWRGEEAAGADAIRSLREHPALAEANVRPMSWLQLQARNTPIPFGMRHYWKGHLVRATSSDLAGAVLDATRGAGEEDFLLIELIHGAAHRVPRASAAFGGRGAEANVTALAIWDEPAVDEARITWARRAAGLVEPFSLAGGGYLNYPEVDQSAARVAAAFGPETFDRLRRLKRAFDPDNRFRHNANVPPA